MREGGVEALSRRLFLLMLLTFVHTVSWAQQSGVEGHVTDAVTGTGIAGATIVLPGFSIGTSTDSEGRFVLAFVPGSATRLHISHVGYHALELSLTPGKRDYHVALEPKTSLLGEVTVEGERGVIESVGDRPGFVRVPVRTFSTIPSIGGERDALRALSILPGFRSNNDLSTSFHVRGGGIGENLVLLDGIPIYNPWHLFGFFSAFNTAALGEVQLMKGGYSAEYGGRLASIVAFETQVGNASAGTEGQFTLSTLNASGAVRGASLDGRLRWMGAARRSHLDPWLWMLSRSAQTPRTSADLDYVMEDANARVIYDATQNVQLSGSFYGGADRLRASWTSSSEAHPSAPEEDDGHYGWRSVAARLATQWNVSKALTTTLSVYGNRHVFGFGTGFTHPREEGPSDSLRYSYDVAYDDYNIRSSTDLFAGRHTVRFGGEATLHRFRDAVDLHFNSTDPRLSRAAVRLDSLTRSRPSVEAGIFLQDTWRTRRMRLQPSLRLSLFRTEHEEAFSAVEPRISAGFQVRPGLHVKAGGAVLRQYLHTAGDDLAVVPFERWFPSGSAADPGRAWQLSAGAQYTAPSRYAADMEVYVRRADGLVALSPLAEAQARDGLTTEGLSGSARLDLMTRFRPLPSDFVFGEGLYYGAEVLVEKRAGRLTGMLSYTLSWARLRFDGLNGGRWYPAYQDRRHDFALFGTYTLREGVRLSASWSFQTGAPFDVPVGYYDFRNHPARPARDLSLGSRDWPNWRQYPARHESRLPSYHRLDLAVMWQSDFLRALNGRGGLWTLSVFNAYNRVNPILLFGRDGSQSTDGDPAKPPRLLKLGILPIIPSLSLTFDFQKPVEAR